jgi:hypothetical protein
VSTETHGITQNEIRTWKLLKSVWDNEGIAPRILDLAVAA